jgi:hypothetical protein
MKIVRKAKSQWTKVFRTPGPSDLLLLYANGAPRSSVAVWHTHPGNDKPHVHIEANEADHHEHAPHKHQHATIAHDHDTEGHWHLPIPAHGVRGVHALLVVTNATIWLAIRDDVAIPRFRRSRAPARAPPLAA